MENTMEVFKNWQTKWPYYPAIPLLGIYTEKTKIEKDGSSSLKHYLQPPGHGNNQNVHGYMDKDDVVYLYNETLLSYKREWYKIISSTTICINFESIMLNEISQRKTNSVWSAIQKKLMNVTKRIWFTDIKNILVLINAETERRRGNTGLGK